MKSLGLILCVVLFVALTQAQTIPPNRQQTFALGKQNYALWWYGASVAAVRYNNSQGPLLSSRTFAIISVAIHDAVNAFNPVAEYYLSHAAVLPPGSNIDAAIAGAGYQSLLRLYPNRIPDWVIVYRTQLSLLKRNKNGIRDVDIRNGFQFGRTIADDIYNNRVFDGAVAALSQPFTPPTGQGFWTPTPPTYAAALGAGWGAQPTWTLLSGSQFRPPGPPFAFPATYEAAYEELLDKGIYPGRGPTTRSAVETYTCFYFAVELPGQYTPPGQIMETAVSIAEAANLDRADTARFFALTMIAQADAVIAAWDAKFFYAHWRPYTAIVNNTNTSLPANPNWFPLLEITPPFPDYVSGHSTLVGAIGRIWQNWFDRDTFRFSTRSDSLPGVNAVYNSFSQFVTDDAYSRVFCGVHFRKSCLDGITTGIQVADWVWTNVLRPTQ